MTVPGRPPSRCTGRRTGARRGPASSATASGRASIADHPGGCRWRSTSRPSGSWRTAAAATETPPGRGSRSVTTALSSSEWLASRGCDEPGRPRVADALLQLGLWIGAYYAYRLVRGFVDGQAGLAFENARDSSSSSAALGLFFEPGLQRWARPPDWIIDVRQLDVRELALRDHARTFLIWLYIARNQPSTSCATCSWSRWASRSSATWCTRPRRRASCPSGASPTPSRTSWAHDGEHRQRALQPVRRRARACTWRSR